MAALARRLLLLCCGALPVAGAQGFEEVWLKYGNNMLIHGFKPPGIGRHPLYIWITGTKLWFNTAADHDLTYAMAQRGYVAAQVKYPNMAYHDTCAFMDQQCSPIFQGQGSALDLLCSQPYVDCSQGVAVHGFSQGAHIAALSSNYDSRISAVLVFGNGNFAHGATSGRHRRLTLSLMRNSSRCLRYAGPPHHRIGKSKVRSIVGSQDKYMGKTLPHVLDQQKITTGYDCGNSTNCIQPDGSGYYIITNQTASSMKHEFFLLMYSYLTEQFKKGDEPWCMKPNLDWLAAAARTGVQVGVASPVASPALVGGATSVAAAFDLEQLPAAPRHSLALAATAATVAALAVLVLAGFALAFRARRRGAAGCPEAARGELLSVE